VHHLFKPADSPHFHTGADNFRFNVLPGDVDQSGTVLGTDVGKTRSHLNTSAGGVGYVAYQDVDGSGMILGTDVGKVRAKLNVTLPVGEPPWWAFGMSDEPMMGMSETPEADSSPSGGVSGEGVVLLSGSSAAGMVVQPGGDVLLRETEVPMVASTLSSGGTVETLASSEPVVGTWSGSGPSEGLVSTGSVSMPEGVLSAAGSRSSGSEGVAESGSALQGSSLWYDILTDPLKRSGRS
jgi:hypothetical protein